MGPEASSPDHSHPEFSDLRNTRSSTYFVLQLYRKTDGSAYTATTPVAKGEEC